MAGTDESERCGGRTTLRPPFDALLRPRATLPTDEELDLAEHKVGIYMSDLDWIVDKLRSASNTISIDEFLRRRAEGEEPEEAEYDPAQLARIVVFAQHVIEDAEEIRQHGAELRRLALSLYDQATSRVTGKRRERIRAWHRAEAGEA